MPFKPGQSGNPKGRAPGFKGMAREIQRRTKDGTLLVDFAMGVLENTENCFTHAHQWDALKWLADRGFGKARDVIELHIGDAVLEGPDFSKLSTEDLQKLNSDIQGVVKRAKLKAVA